MKQLADGTWIIDSGSTSSPDSVIYGTNGRLIDVQFASGGTGGVHHVVPQPKRLKAAFKVPAGAKTIQADVNNGRVVLSFFDEYGSEIARMSSGLE